MRKTLVKMKGTGTAQILPQRKLLMWCKKNKVKRQCTIQTVSILSTFEQAEWLLPVWPIEKRLHGAIVSKKPKMPSRSYSLHDPKRHVAEFLSKT